MERPHKDHIFGSLSGKSWIGRGERVAGAGADERRVVPKFELKTRIGDEKEDAKVRAFLRGEVLADGKPSKGFLVDEGVGEGFGDGEGLFLQSWVVNQDSGYGWTAEQVGFLLLLCSSSMVWLGLLLTMSIDLGLRGYQRPAPSYPSCCRCCQGWEVHPGSSCLRLHRPTYLSGFLLILMYFAFCAGLETRNALSFFVCY